MLFQTFKIALNSVANIHHRFVASFPLRDAAGQSWAFGDKHAVFIRFNRDAKFHAASLAIAGAVRNATLCGRHSESIREQAAAATPFTETFLHSSFESLPVASHPLQPDSVYFESVGIGTKGTESLGSERRRRESRRADRAGGSESICG
jgi:hypothetical protein